jgi:hypothetical protein
MPAAVKAPARHARKLRWPAQIFNPNKTQTSSGAMVNGTPILVGKVYFDILTEPRRRQGSDEDFKGGRLTSELYHLVLIRYSAGVIPTYYIYPTAGPYEGRIMDILTVALADGRMRWMELSCLERRTSGTP